MILRTAIAALLVAAIWLAAGGAAEAALIAATSFDDSDSDGELAGESGGFGWSATDDWTANTGVTELVDPGGTMVFDVPGALSVDGGTSALQVTGNSTLTARDLATSFDATSDPDVYMSFLFRWDAGGVGNNDFAVFRYNTTDVNVGLKADTGPGGTDFVARFSTSNQAYGDEQVTIPETVFLVAHLWDSNANGDYDSHAIWTNPGYYDSGSPEATATGGSFGSSITEITMRYVNVDSNDVLLFDELRIGTTWADVMPPVPEPATLVIWSLLAAVGVGVGWRRRRRR